MSAGCIDTTVGASVMPSGCVGTTVGAIRCSVKGVIGASVGGVRSRFSAVGSRTLGVSSRGGGGPHQPVVEIVVGSYRAWILWYPCLRPSLSVSPGIVIGPSPPGEICGCIRSSRSASLPQPSSPGPIARNGRIDPWVPRSYGWCCRLLS